MSVYVKIGVAICFVFVFFSCENNSKTKYADGYPSLLAGNWVVFEFQGAELDGYLSDAYDMSTALAPNDDNMLVLNNLYNSGTRIKANIQGDTGFFALKTDQLEVINFGGYGIHKISISGYINDNPVIKDFVYRLALSQFTNMAFSYNDMEEIIFYRAGFYDQYDGLVDTVMVFGYRKTGFEEEDFNN